MPNNTKTRQYNVTASYALLTADIPATISNLSLESGIELSVTTQNFSVTGTTLNDLAQGNQIQVESQPDAPAMFGAGKLSSFSGGVLRGTYLLRSNGSPAVLSFTGAAISTLSDSAFVFLSGSQAKVADESGNNALSHLSQIASSASLSVSDQEFTTLAPLTIDGTLYVTRGSGSLAETTFTAAAALANFDQVSHTLSGGSFWLSGELRFANADVVNNASDITLLAGARISDLAGNDGLRNFAHNLENGSLYLENHPITAAGDFSNDGSIILNASDFVIAGRLTNLDPATRTLRGGVYKMTGSKLQFSGADILHNSASITLINGKITDTSGADAFRNFSSNEKDGTFVLQGATSGVDIPGPSQSFTAAGDFTNAGKVVVSPGNHDPFMPRIAYGSITVRSGFKYMQTAGSTDNGPGCIFTSPLVQLDGGVFRNYGTIRGNVDVRVAALLAGGIQGDLALADGSHFLASIASSGEATGASVTGQAHLAGSLDVSVATVPSNTSVISALSCNGGISGVFENAPTNGSRAFR